MARAGQFDQNFPRGEQKAKLESIPRMLKLGLSLEIIASSLDLPLEVVQQAAGSSHNQ